MILGLNKKMELALKKRNYFLKRWTNPSIPRLRVNPLYSKRLPRAYHRVLRPLASAQQHVNGFAFI